MKSEHDTDHEMEEVLRGAGLTTTKELDLQVLAAAGAAPSEAGGLRFLRLVAAAMMLLAAGATWWSWQAWRQEEAPSASQLVVTQRVPTNGQVVLTFNESLNRSQTSYSNPSRAPNVGGAGGAWSSSMNHYQWGGGGGGSGGRVPNGLRGGYIDLSKLTPTTVVGGAGGAGGAVGGRRYVPGGYTYQYQYPGGSSGAGGRVKVYPGSDINLLPSRPMVGLIDGYITDSDMEPYVLPEHQVDSRRWDRLAERYEGEEYDRRTAIPFLSPRKAPLSTFSVDVDTASYANVRRFLSAGQMPPADAVRIEEMVNYFSYAYPQPEGDQPFAVVVDAAECPWNPKFRLVRIGVQGRRIEQDNVPPRNLVFLLDVSGSMKSEDKLPLVKSAMKLLAGELRKEDRVAIVTYASGTNVVLEPTSGDQRFEIIGAIDKLTAAGSTDAGSGIQLAYEMARRHFEKGAINRVLLATDGDFNVGITDRAALEALITAEREHGVFLTVLGVGTGNLKDSQMEMLADKGNGNYAYLDSILEAQKVLVHEAGATLVTIAKDVKIQVEFNPARVAAYRLVGYENRMLAARDFNDDTKDAGEIGAGHSVTALYEVIPAGVAVPQPAINPLRYQKPDAAPEPEVNEELGDEMLFLRLRYKEPEGTESKLLEFPLTDPGAVSINETDDDFAFAAAVAVFGKILRNAPETRNLNLSLVEEIAAGAVGKDENGYRKEFLELVKRASKLGR